MLNKLEIKNISLDLRRSVSTNSKILKDISFEAKDKEFIAIVGPSGCGKTSLIKIIAGLLEPSGGEIYLDGVKTSGLSKKIGYVFQNPVAFPWLSVRENIEFTLKNKGIPEAERKTISSHLINSIGLRGYEEYFVNSLSGGMKQRVAIATVLANDTEVLLMDEPFSALDTQTRGLMQELLLNIWEQKKKTVVFVTHDIEEAIFMADRVYIMGAKPGHIKKAIEIDLPRPRVPNIKFSEEFFKIRKHISYLVRGESIKSAHVNVDNLNPNALRVGLHTWPGIAPFFIAQELGYFKEEGVAVELINLEKDENRNQAFLRSEVDLFTTLIDEAILLKSKEPDLKIVQILNSSSGGDGLIVADDVASISELRGKRIAVEAGWVNHYFLLNILHKNGLREKNVEIVDCKGSDVGAALINKSVSAAVTYEPWLSEAQGLSGARLLASTKDNPVLIDVLIGNKGAIDSRKDDIDKLLRALKKVAVYMQEQKTSSAEIASSYFGVSVEEFKNLLSKVNIYETDPDAKEIKNVVKEANQIFMDEGIINSPIIVNELFDRNII